jgi:predicted Zn-dependent protease
VTGEREFVLMSEAQELSLGRQADGEIQRDMGVYDDPVLQEYVQEVGLSLAEVSHRPDLPWQFTVVDSPAVNAFALPGGYIYLTRGIMAYLGDEAELAGVLGHEIGHVTARHAVQAYTRAGGAQLGLVLGQVFVPQMRSNPYGLPGLGDAAGSGLGLLFLKFGRDDEMQADRLGAEYASDGGWHPQGVADMLSTLGRIGEAADRRGTPNWLSTHPEPEARVGEVTPAVDELLAGRDDTALRVNREDYLDRIEGLLFGDNPEDGILRGNEFLHPTLRFALEFPEGWEVQNSATVVMATQPGQELFMLLQLAENTRGGDLERIAEEEMGSAGYRLRSGGEADINGLDAFLGTYSGQVDNIGEVVARVAHIRHDRDVYVLGGLGPADTFLRVEGDVNESIRSFRPLSREEAERIFPNEIALYVARAGDTWQSIAQRDGDEIVTARTLAIMNGYPVNEQPRTGDRIKVVVPGGR